MVYLKLNNEVMKSAYKVLLKIKKNRKFESLSFIFAVIALFVKEKKMQNVKINLNYKFACENPRNIVNTKTLKYKVKNFRK